MGKAAPDLSQYLRAGEQVLWQGRPVAPPPRKILPLSNILLGVAVWWGLAAVYWALGDHPIFRLPITALLAMLALGLLLPLFAAPIANHRFMRKTVYVITPERAIIFGGKQLFSQPLNADTGYRLSGTSPETLEIWSNADQARAAAPPMRFQQLADGAVAFAVLEQVLNGDLPFGKNV